MPRGGAVIGKDVAVMRCHPSARFMENDVGSSEIPVVLPVECQRSIGRPASNKRDAIGNRVALKNLHLRPGFSPCRVAKHGRKGHHPASFNGRRTAHMDWLVIKEGTAAEPRLKKLIRCRIEQHTKRGAPC